MLAACGREEFQLPKIRADLVGTLTHVPAAIEDFDYDPPVLTIGAQPRFEEELARFRENRRRLNQEPKDTLKSGATVWRMPVVIRADRRTPWREVSRLIRHAGSSGIRAVYFEGGGKYGPTAPVRVWLGARPYDVQHVVALKRGRFGNVTRHLDGAPVGSRGDLARRLGGLVRIEAGDRVPYDAVFDTMVCCYQARVDGIDLADAKGVILLRPVR